MQIPTHKHLRITTQMLTNSFFTGQMERNPTRFCPEIVIDFFLHK